MTERTSAVIERFADDHAEAVGATRFFHNEAVEPEALLAATRRCLDRALRETDTYRAGTRRVLVIQDTTELDYTPHAGRLRWRDAEIGPLSNARHAGFFVHPSLVIDEQTGLPLGLVDVALWNRSWHRPDKHARDYQRLPIEQKESYRWVRSSEHAKQHLPSDVHLTIVADREGDIYDWLARVPDHRTDLVIRSRIDRCLAPGEAAGKLYARLAQQPRLGEVRFELRATPKRQARRMQGEVRVAPVMLARPSTATRDLPDALPLWAVEVREVGAVPANEEPVAWRLLVTRPVGTLGEALGVVDQYRQRWHIEQLFRTMKREGLEAEASQLARGVALQRLCLVALQAAAVVMQLVLERGGAAQVPASLVFSESEEALLVALSAWLSGRTMKQQNPHAQGSLAWAGWVIARLGGWKCYGSPPGPVRMARGLSRFAERYAGWQLSTGDPPEGASGEKRTNEVYGE